MSDSFNQFRRTVGKGLESNRWSMKSAVAIFLFGAIIVVFVFFGFPGKNSGMGAGVGSAAIVNRTLISIADVRSETSRIEQIYAPMFGGNIGASQRQFMVQSALETLINQELIFQLAHKAGIQSTDAEIQDIITRDITAFQKNGRFQKDLYFGLLEANRLTPQDFETKIRKERIGIRAQKLFEASAFPSNLELQKVQALREQKMNVQFARVDKDMMLEKMALSSAEVSKKLTDAEFAKATQDYFAANKMEFVEPAQVKAQHILIKISAQRNEAAALKEIERISGLAQSTDFGKLAAQFSEDEGSKKNNGDLGYFGAGKMVPEFEKAAFSQNPGEVGAPVKTNYGYHLIKVTDRKAGGEKKFEEVKTQIAQKLLATQAYDQEIKSIEEALAKRDVGAVDALLKKMGATWTETGFFDLSSDQVPNLNSAEASRAVVSLDEGNKLYPLLIRDGTQRFVMKLKEMKKESGLKLDEIRQQVTRERAMDDFKSWVETQKKSAHIERHINPETI